MLILVLSALDLLRADIVDVVDDFMVELVNLLLEKLAQQRTSLKLLFLNADLSFLDIVPNVYQGHYLLV